MCPGTTPGEMEDYMAFFTSAVTTLKTLVIALGAGLGVWGVSSGRAGMIEVFIVQHE